MRMQNKVYMPKHVPEMKAIIKCPDGLELHVNQIYLKNLTFIFLKVALTNDKIHCNLNFNGSNTFGTVKICSKKW